MKILSGTARGRTVRTLPNNPLVRPILARIKKSVFDIIRPRIVGSHFLDLYAGTGSVGLEALSEGASHATFVEQEPKCVRLIHENITLFKFDSQASVFRMSAVGDLSFLPKNFDLIFMGPPYKDAQKNPLALVTPTLENISKYSLLNPKGLVIAQHHKNEKVTSFGPWNLKRQEKYGDTLVTFFTLTPA
ncbi:MAG: Ribosomal RNA small subunit methyltransferase D [Elusimicrobia bacterium]|nr:Ribosomal RNA small subunit methyltransferase D [Elusimicrobiota bacterium]